MGHLQHCSSSIHWELNFICAVQDWELESITTLDLLYSCPMKGYGEDTLLWKHLGRNSLWLAGIIRLWSLVWWRIFLGKLSGNLKSPHGCFLSLDDFVGKNFDDG